MVIHVCFLVWMLATEASCRFSSWPHNAQNPNKELVQTDTVDQQIDTKVRNRWFQPSIGPNRSSRRVMTTEVASTGEQPTMHQSSEAQQAPAATRRCRLRNNSSIATEEFLNGESSPQEVRGVIWRLGSNWLFLSADFALILLPVGKNHFSHFRPLYFPGDKCLISPLLSNAVKIE